MKILFYSLYFLLFIPVCISGQSSQKVRIDNNKVSADSINPQFKQIFPDFRGARIHYKGMMPIKCQANYNFLLDEILYINEKGEMMALANPVDLQYAIIDNRKFIPIHKGYYEVIDEGEISLIYKWHCRIRQTKKEGVLGIDTDAPSVYQMNRISFDAKEWKMDVAQDALAFVEVVPYLKAKTKLIAVKGAGSFYKAYKGKSSEIKKYLSENPVDFKQEKDLRRLTTFTNGLE